MRRLNRDQYVSEMRQRLGNYPDNVYSEREVFRGEKTASGGAGVGAVYEPISVVRNRVSFNITPFSYTLTDGSKQLLPSNELRRFLSVQNQSLADLMYVNFTTEAGVNAGVELYPAQALIYDFIVPYNSVNVIVNSATKQRGVVVEGALQL